jgi:DNA modification methylase
MDGAGPDGGPRCREDGEVNPYLGEFNRYAFIRPVYDRDGISIYRGDCRTILPHIDSFDACLIADPPYGFGQSNQRRRKRAANDPGRDGDFTEIVGDREPFDPAFILGLGFETVVLFGANHYADQLPPSTGWLVWDKRNGATPDDNADAELIWTNRSGVVRMHRQCWRGFTREDDGLEPHKHLHPTQKPVKLMMWIVERFTKPGDLVVDPYMGSGPIAKACQLLGRRYTGVELDERYCNAAISRLQQSVMVFA